MNYFICVVKDSFGHEVNLTWVLKNGNLNFVFNYKGNLVYKDLSINIKDIKWVFDKLYFPPNEIEDIIDNIEQIDFNINDKISLDKHYPEDNYLIPYLENILDKEYLEHKALSFYCHSDK